MLSNHFRKYHSCGNSALVFFDPDPESHPIESSLIRTLLASHSGIGADNLLIIKPSRLHDYEIIGFNRDGSPVGMCMNGVRCVTAFLLSDGRITPSQRSIQYLLEGNTVSASVDPRLPDCIAVGIHNHTFSPSKIPHSLPPVFCEPHKETPLETFTVSVLDQTFEVACVSVGNPHCVIFCQDVSRIDIEAIGPAIEHHEHFPHRTNVEFVEIIDSESIKVRFWERGVGSTLSSGSGSLSAYLVAHKGGFVGERALISVPGGQLTAFMGHGGVPTISGPVTEVFRGTLSPQFKTSFEKSPAIASPIALAGDLL